MTRVLPLEGSRNLRDLGGYRTGDGRQVRWGLLFRSGSLRGLTLTGLDELRTRGIKALCDLRTTSERETEPFPVEEFAGLKYWARDYWTSFAELRRTMRSGLGTYEEARGAMIAGYRELAFEQSASYRQLFAWLKEGEVPILFNCSAGKDRTGMAAALVLGALGVPRETVIEDFLLTNDVLDLRRALFSRSSNALGTQPDDVVSAIVQADSAYLTAALDSIDERHGGIDGFLNDVLDVSQDDVAKLRDALLE